MNHSDCPFCERSGLLINEHWRLIEDAYPVSKNHHLLIPVKHISDLRELNTKQWESLSNALKATINFLTKKGMIDFNCGVNNGINAGQTINHLHFHFIPRISGDVSQPRGGIRSVIPLKKEYP